MNIKIKVDSNSTLVGTMIPVGSRNEPDSIKGISHFLEHLMFKGTKTRNMTEIKQAVDKYGATFNAWTSEEHTFFYVIIANRYADKGREVIDDMINNSIFPEKELEKEKQVVLQELEMYHDNPQTNIFTLAQKQIIKDGSGLHIPILGTKESVLGIDRETLIKYYEQHYKNQLKIDVGGNVVEKRNKIGFYGRKFKQEVKNYTKQNYFERRTGINQANMTVAGLFNINNVREEMALDIFSAVMNGFCGRFFNVIREQNNLVYTTRFYNQTHSCGTTQYWAYAGLLPDKVQFARDLMIEQLTKKITEDEFNYAKGKLLGQYELNIENKSNIARILINCALNLTDYEYFLTNFKENLESITLNEVNKIATKAKFENSKLIAIVPK